MAERNVPRREKDFDGKNIFNVNPPKFTYSSDITPYMKDLLIPPPDFRWMLKSSKHTLQVPDPIHMSLVLAVMDKQPEPFIVYLFNNDDPLEEYVTDEEIRARPRTLIAYGDVDGLACYRCFVGQIGLTRGDEKTSLVVGKHQGTNSFQFNEHGRPGSTCYEFIRMRKLVCKEYTV